MTPTEQTIWAEIKTRSDDDVGTDDVRCEWYNEYCIWKQLFNYSK